MTTPRARTNPPTQLTDDLLVATLINRAAGVRTGPELVGSVIGRLDAVPQGRRWSWVVPQRRVLSLALVGLVTVGLLGLGSFAGRLIPTPAPDPGVIAYAGATFRWNGDLTVEGHALFTKPGDGGEAARLVDVPGAAEPSTFGLPEDGGVRLGPALRWSPDGTRIAFRLYNNSAGIYVMDRDGSGLRVLAESRRNWLIGFESNSSFAWSPDGTQIAFISPDTPPPHMPAAFNGRLYVIDADGSSGNLPREVAPAASGTLAWSPDGSRIAFGRSYANRSGIVVVNADGTGERQLTDLEAAFNHMGAIAWSPTGSKMAFIHEDLGGDLIWSVNVVNPDGTDLQLVGGPWPGGCCIHGAFGGVLEWSPDGTLLATTRDIHRISVVAADGSGEQLLLSGDHVDWSPDGSRLVYSTAGPVVPGSDPVHRSSAIFVVNLDGTGRRWLADGDYPAWSP